MHNQLKYSEWVKYNLDSITDLYYQLINYNSNLFTKNACSLNTFKYFCYLNSSKEKYKYL